MSISLKLWFTVLLTLLGFVVIGIKYDNNLIVGLGLAIVSLNALIIILVISDISNDQYDSNPSNNDKILNQISEVLEKSKNGFFNQTVTEKTQNKKINKIKNNLNSTLNEISAYLNKSSKILDEYEKEKKK